MTTAMEVTLPAAQVVYNCTLKCLDFRKKYKLLILWLTDRNDLRASCQQSVKPLSLVEKVNVV